MSPDFLLFTMEYANDPLSLRQSHKWVALVSVKLEAWATSWWVGANTYYQALSKEPISLDTDCIGL